MHSACGANDANDARRRCNVGAADRVGERALIRLFCLGVHSPAHYQAYCPSHCYPYHDVSLFCNFPHLTDTTASPSTPIPTPFSFLSSAFAPRYFPDLLAFPLSHFDHFSSTIPKRVSMCLLMYHIEYYLMRITSSLPERSIIFFVT